MSRANYVNLRLKYLFHTSALVALVCVAHAQVGPMQPCDSHVPRWWFEQCGDAWDCTRAEFDDPDDCVTIFGSSPILTITGIPLLDANGNPVTEPSCEGARSRIPVWVVARGCEVVRPFQDTYCNVWVIGLLRVDQPCALYTSCNWDMNTNTCQSTGRLCSIEWIPIMTPLPCIPRLHLYAERHHKPKTRV